MRASERSAATPAGNRSRALDGLSGSMLVALGTLLLAHVMTRESYSLLISWRDGQLLEWFFMVGIEFAVGALLATPMLLAVVVVSNLGPQQGGQRIVALALAVLLATPVGFTLRYAIFNVIEGWPWDKFLTVGVPAFWIRYGTIGLLLTAVYAFYRHETQSVDAMHQAEVDKIALDREMAEARMQVLQAQIEPHFLFNTLANVRRLYQTDAASGRSMLENLMRYLEVALPRMRERESTLGREATLVESYLNVQQIRMGRRLAFRIEIPAALNDARVPPMMLLTLVENAIKHGLNPLPEGGFLHIAAHRDNGKIVVTVSDTGQGFKHSSGGGTGLANIRARLAAAYGNAANLALALNTPRGVTATLALPADAAIAAA